MKEACRIILTEHKNSPMHYKEIAAEAEARGYRSRVTGKVKPESFAIIMDQSKQIFEKLEGRRFRLRG